MSTLKCTRRKAKFCSNFSQSSKALRAVHATLAGTLYLHQPPNVKIFNESNIVVPGISVRALVYLISPR